MPRCLGQHLAHSRAPQVCAVTALTSCPTAPHALATFKHAEHSPPQDLCTCLYSHRATQAGTLPVASLAAPLSPSFRPGSGDCVCGWLQTRAAWKTDWGALGCLLGRLLNAPQFSGQVGSHSFHKPVLTSWDICGAIFPWAPGQLLAKSPESQP